jgi:putative membrane protein
MGNQTLRRAAALLLGGVLCLGPAPALAAEAAAGVHKQETVYGELEADGTLTGTTVSVYLSNPSGENQIDDVTNLTSLETVSGDMAPTVTNGAMTWKANGEDVLYQGESSEEPPVSVAIVYELDGQAITPQQLLGKSGRLKMTFTFTNHEKSELTLPAYGEEEVDKTVWIYTPFTVATLLTLPQDHFTDITTDADRTITQGDSTVVVDLAFPGLYESMGRTDTEGTSQKMTLEAQVENFTLEEITFLVTPKLIDDTDLTQLTQLDELRESLETTQQGSEELVRGADSLKGGARTFAKAAKQYVSGVNTMATGVKELAGALPQLAAGGKALADGLDGIKEQTDELKLTGEDGALEKIEALLQDSQGLDSALQALEENMATMDEMLGQLDGSIQALEDAKKALEDSGASGEQIASIQQQIDRLNTLRTQMADNRESLEAQLTAVREALPQVKPWVDQAAGGLEEMTRGLEELRTGARALSDGLTDLNNQSAQMTEGADLLLKNGGKITSGADQLASGLATFARGLHDFNEQAVDQLAGGAAGEIYDFQLRKAALIEASGRYTSFTGLGSAMTGDVTFVLRTPLQKAQPIPEPEPTATPQPEAGSASSSGWQRFWQWLTGIFGG